MIFFLKGHFKIKGELAMNIENGLPHPHNSWFHKIVSLIFFIFN